MENPLQNIDLPLFKKQKMFLVELSHDTINKQEDALIDGIVNFMDAVQDYLEHETL